MGIVLLVLGVLIGMCLMAIVSMNTINEYEELINIERNKVKQRNKTIDELLKQRNGLEKVVESLKEDNKSVLEEAYKTAKRPKKEVIKRDQAN